jgi:hypothetical protein
MTCLQPSKASWLCNSHPGCLTGGILSPTDKPGAPEQVLAIVHACPPTKPASCICIIAFCMTFSLREPVSLTLCVSGEGYRPFLAPWTTMGRALRPDQDPAASRCGFLLLAIIDGNAAAVCAAV